MRIVSNTAKAPEVERVASRDVSRPVLQYVHLNVENATLEATDSYKAVVIPVELDDGDVSGPIPAEALKEQRKVSRSARCAVSLAAAATEVTLKGPDGSRGWSRHDVGTFPDIARLGPANVSRFRIGLSPKFLLDLAQGLGNPDSVILEFSLESDKVEGDDTGVFPAPLRPIRVTTPAGGDSYGILMPIRVKE